MSSSEESNEPSQPRPPVEAGPAAAASAPSSAPGGENSGARPRRRRRPGRGPRRPGSRPQGQEYRSESPVSGGGQEPRSNGPIGKALRDLEDIISTLKKAVNDLEVVFEFLEEADIQKVTTDRELESLRRALRQLHRPRDPVQSHPASAAVRPARPAVEPPPPPAAPPTPPPPTSDEAPSV